MDVKVLGPGCARCGRQFEEARKAIDLAEVDATLEKVSDLEAIAGYGVLGTPAVVIDGRIRSTGRVVKARKIADWLLEG